MKKPAPIFNTEAELCAAFLEWLKRYPDWTPYPETEGWDILLVHVDATQIGIQAKLKFNMNVLQQAVEYGFAYEDVGPDFRAILVGSGDWPDLCNALGLTLIRPDRSRSRPAFTPDMGNPYGHEHWHYANPKRRCKLPAYVPDVPCGVPSPSPLTPWKIKALEIVATLELRGSVTRQDFKIAGIDHRRWTEQWLEAVPNEPGVWRWATNRPQWERNHPRVYPEILAKVRERLNLVLVP